MTLLLTLALFFVFYVYLGYPLLLWIQARRVPPPQNDQIGPATPVTVLIAAYNEEESIQRTLESILQSDYPKEALHICVVSDASTDRTDAIIQALDSPRVKRIRQPYRQGKPAALRRGLLEVISPVCVLTDANACFTPQTIRTLVRHLTDSTVGAVSGVRHILRTDAVTSSSDGLYYRYDSYLRWLESRTHASWVGCEGGLFAIRTHLLQLNFPDHIAEDYAICCRVYEKGFRHLHDPEANMFEAASETLAWEFQRKVRVVVRGIHGFFAFRHLLDPFRHPAFFFQNMSHRLGRWLIPFFLVFLWVGSAYTGHAAWKGFFWIQTFFYATALLGFLLRKRPLKILSAPLYFVVVNTAALVSWGLLFRRYATWQRVTRDQAR